MTFAELLRTIVAQAKSPITPQEIHGVIKGQHPDFYGTPSHRNNVEKGYYTSLDHALLANIYTTIRNDPRLHCDTSTKPMKVSVLVDDLVPPRRDRTAVAKSSRRRSHSEAAFAEKVRHLLANMESYHAIYYAAEVFRGPSLYFHLRALATRQDPCSLAHLEYVYATLASWGMHRMGEGGSKMQPFNRFRQSVESLRERILEAQQYDLLQMDEPRWMGLREIFYELNVMASRTRLVGNSKVMHHFFPNLVPPIDREYTLMHLFGNKNITNDIDAQWALMRDILERFFAPVLSDCGFRTKPTGIPF
jgi:hypothetical protein